MVSTTLDFVSVELVIEPCVKFGTTGTEYDGCTKPWTAPRINPKPIASCNLVIGI